MITTLTPLDVALILFNVAVVVAIVVLARAVWRLGRFKAGIIAHAKQAQQPPDRNLIEGWKYLYKTLPEGTPKHTAYKNRLDELGFLNEDGTVKDE